MSHSGGVRQFFSFFLPLSRRQCIPPSTIVMSLFLPLGTHCSSRALSRSSVRAGSLPVNRQSPSVTKPTIRPDIHKPFNIHRNFRPEISFHFILGLQDGAKLGHFFFRQFIRILPGIYSCRFQQLPGCCPPHTIDIRQCNLHFLVPGKINTSNSSHCDSSLTSC